MAVTVELAEARDEPGIRALLAATPMAGDISLTLEREPDSRLAGAIEGDVHDVVVARDAAGAVIGMGSRSVRDGWVGGEATRLGYLSQLRVAPAHRGKPRMFLKGYEVLAARHREDGGPPLYVTTIVSDNEPARRLLERGLRGVPTYRALDELVTLSLTLARARAPAPPPGVTLHPARPEDLDAIVACLARAGRRRRVATRWSREDLLDPERTRGLAIEDFHLARRRDAVVGCLARWDQRAYKQVVIRGYSRRLAMLRPVANLLGPVLRLPHLPPVGAVLDTLYLSHVAVDEDDPAVLLALVGDAAVQARDHGFGHATLGLSGRGGLARAVQAAFPAQEYRSQVYLVHWEDGAAAAAAIEPGPTHLEVAVL